MLQIKDISKEYRTGDLVQKALDHVSLSLRENEFVAVLGPSGSGKTTLLNIIGGLDRYDSGDLLINNVSTKAYKDRDWDSYRNHTIGFVFQSYNLIPHQNILSNVELALTISGISARERRERALKALDEVGLKDQAHKRPNQLSGGQMQRVAIARALVNEPRVLLADEPTGALDTKTSVQVMDLLKKVAEDRLVVMVTHNPELAEQYANRIVRLQDGQIVSDTNPYVEEEETEAEHRNFGKAHMSFLTALSLSFNNLLTKKGRTVLTAFAGSIGIIGIALILSLSTGFQNYIDKIQEDTMSSYPLRITSETADASTMILSMVSTEKGDRETETLIERQYISSMFSSVGSNDIRSFGRYVNEHMDEVSKGVSYIKYSYSIAPLIYTEDATDTVVQLNPSSFISSFYSQGATSMVSSFSSQGGIFTEMVDDRETLERQYEVLKGRWPENWNEMIVVLSEPGNISDLLVYSLGLRDTAKLKELMNHVMAREEVQIEDEPLRLTYDDLLNLDLRLLYASDLYRYNTEYEVYEDMRGDVPFMENAYAKAEPLKIVGIVTAREGSQAMALSAGVAYTRDLTLRVMKEAEGSPLVQKQLQDPKTDVFSGKEFGTDEKNTLNFEDMISIDEDAVRDAFRINLPKDPGVSAEESAKIIMETSERLADTLQGSGAAMTAAILAADSNVSSAMIEGYPAWWMKDNVHCEIYTDDNDHSLGCEIPYPEQSDEYAEIAGKTYQKKQMISLSEGRIAQYKNEFKNSDAYKEALKMQIEGMDVPPEAMGMLVSDEVVNAVFDNYIDTLLERTGGERRISIGEIASVNSLEVIASTLANEEIRNQIYNTTADTVKNYTTGIIAAGIGEATAKMMAPLASLFNEDIFSFDSEAFSRAFKFELDQDELKRLMEATLDPGSGKTYSSNLLSLGYQDEEEPTSISFYFRDFEGKENFLDFIKRYNDASEEEQQIKYTDITGFLMESVKTIVDSVSYVLIAFVSISLVVSSIMIAVITLISVMERTKEIGILRAMGASKRNISSIFNAETFIIGLLSGLLGVGTSLLLLIPINAIIHHLTDNPDITAVLPVKGAIALVIISFILTLIAGFIPSKSAARKDPVIALRTE